MSTEDKTIEKLEGEKKQNDWSSCVTAEQRKNFNLRNFILRHIRAGSKAQKYELFEIHLLLELAKKAFEGGKALVEVKAPVNICGDTHGQFSDLLRIFNACGFPTTTRYLFLGDYVDRGRHSLEVICLLFAFRILLPKKLILLRGNHELKAINKTYGFLGELGARFRGGGGEHMQLWEHFNHVFQFMPLSAVVSNRILCMHGGISPSLNSLQDIADIPLPLENVKNNPLAQDLLWADPEPNVKGFKKNKLRAISHVFGEEAVAAICKKLDLDLVVRAHQVVEYGYAFFGNRSLITVFSASRYHEELHNYAAVVVVGNDLELSFVQLKPEEFEKRRDESDLKKDDHEEALTGNVEEQVKKK